MQSNKYLSIILGLVLIINIALFSKVGDLNNQIAALSQNYNNLRTSVDSISTNVNETLDQFKREQSWITPVEMNEEKTKIENERVTAVLNWQIKDFQEGAEVVFHYRQSESGEFTTIPAASKGGGIFEVSVPLVIKVEPPWAIDMTITSKDNGFSGSKSNMPDSAAPAIGYYISMKTGDTLKSSEIADLDPVWLTQTKYEPVQGHVNISDNKLNISIFEHYPGANNFESVILKIYDGDNLVAEKALDVQPTENNTKVYSLSYDAGSQNITSLILQVKYTNGNTFTREIY